MEFFERGCYSGWHCWSRTRGSARRGRWWSARSTHYWIQRQHRQNSLSALTETEIIFITSKPRHIRHIGVVQSQDTQPSRYLIFKSECFFLSSLHFLFSEHLKYSLAFERRFSSIREKILACIRMKHHLACELIPNAIHIISLSLYAATIIDIIISKTLM